MPEKRVVVVVHLPMGYNEKDEMDAKIIADSIAAGGSSAVLKPGWDITIKTVAIGE